MIILCLCVSYRMFLIHYVLYWKQLIQVWCYHCYLFILSVISHFSPIISLPLSFLLPPLPLLTSEGGVLRVSDIMSHTLHLSLSPLYNGTYTFLLDRYSLFPSLLSFFLPLIFFCLYLSAFFFPSSFLFTPSCIDSMWVIIVIQLHWIFWSMMILLEW